MDRSCLGNKRVVRACDDGGAPPYYSLIPDIPLSIASHLLLEYPTMMALIELSSILAGP